MNRNKLVYRWYTFANRNHVMRSERNSMAVIAGVDGCPSVLTIDVPIGLTDAAARACDLEARTKLGVPRSSSVFPAPVRSTLNATTYANACRLGAKADGRKLSRQTWAILRKKREVDTFLRSDLPRQEWVREVHPEVCFWAWNGNRPMSYRKKSQDGKAEREALVIPRYDTAYTVSWSTLPAGKFSRDDLLDAFSALWTAERVYLVHRFINSVTNLFTLDLVPSEQLY
jgi:predicted RNase H-like nuclease